jgi:hypothetical protein
MSCLGAGAAVRCHHLIFQLYFSIMLGCSAFAIGCLFEPPGLSRACGVLGPALPLRGKALLTS